MQKILVISLTILACFFSHAQGNKIVVLTTDFGSRDLINSPLYLATKFLSSTGYKAKFKIQGKKSMWWDEHYASTYEVANRYGLLIRQALVKGYSVDIYPHSVPDDFMQALVDEEVAVILHEGHGLTDINDRSIVALEFNQKPLLIENIKNFSGNRLVKTSSSLQFIYSSSCRGGYCLDYYSPSILFESPYIANKNDVQLRGDFHGIHQSYTEILDKLELQIKQLPIQKGFNSFPKVFLRKLSILSKCGKLFSYK